MSLIFVHKYSKFYHYAMNRSIAIKEEVYQVLKERARQNYRAISSQLELDIMKTEPNFSNNHNPQ